MKRPEDHGTFTYVDGPLAVVRVCKWCSHKEILRKGLAGVGRGYGMREGNKARGRMIQHAKEVHPAEYAASRDEDTAPRPTDTPLVAKVRAEKARMDKRDAARRAEWENRQQPGGSK